MTSLEPEIWFFVRDGRRAGPFDRAGLLRELLALEAPEAALVWRSGLPAWTKAHLLDELRRDLPPPVPGASLAMPVEFSSPDPPMPDLPEAPEETTGDLSASVPESARATPLSDGDFAEEAGDHAPPTDEERSRRRRRRRHRHPKSTGLPGYAIPLALLFVAVMIGLWFLLRRMNEVPPGRIILQGDLGTGKKIPLSGSRSRAIPGSTRGEHPSPLA